MRIEMKQKELLHFQLSFLLAHLVWANFPVPLDFSLFFSFSPESRLFLFLLNKRLEIKEIWETRPCFVTKQSGTFLPINILNRFLMQMFSKQTIKNEFFVHLAFIFLSSRVPVSMAGYVNFEEIFIFLAETMLQRPVWQMIKKDDLFCTYLCLKRKFSLINMELYEADRIFSSNYWQDIIKRLQSAPHSRLKKSRIVWICTRTIIEKLSSTSKSAKNIRQKIWDSKNAFPQLKNFTRKQLCCKCSSGACFEN